MFFSKLVPEVLINRYAELDIQNSLLNGLCVPTEIQLHRTHEPDFIIVKGFSASYTIVCSSLDESSIQCDWADDHRSVAKITGVARYGFKFTPYENLIDYPTLRYDMFQNDSLGLFATTKLDSGIGTDSNVLVVASDSPIRLLELKTKGKDITGIKVTPTLYGNVVPPMLITHTSKRVLIMFDRPLSNFTVTLDRGVTEMSKRNYVRNDTRNDQLMVQAKSEDVIEIPTSSALVLMEGV